MAELRGWAPLEHRAADLARIADLTTGTIQITEETFLQQLDIRTQDPTSFGLPTSPNTWREMREMNGVNALWLGPDEWLVVGGADAVRDAWEGSASIVDVGASRAVLDLGGPGVRDLLLKGSSLDLHPSKWASGACAQTMLAKAPVLLQQRQDVTRIFVRPSFTDYLLEWFLAACT